MAFCSKCGTPLEDGARFCPKCGQPANQQHEDIVEPTKEEFKENDEMTAINNAFKELGIAKQIAFALSLICVVMGVMKGLDRSEFGLIVLAATPVIGLYCILKGKLRSFHIWWITLVSIIIAFIAMSIPGNKPNEPTTDGQKTEQSADDKTKEATPQKSKENEIKELGYRDGVKLGYSDKGDHLRSFVQMGMTLEDGLKNVKASSKTAYKEDYGDDISEELLEIYSEGFLEGYKSVVIKK